MAKSKAIESALRSDEPIKAPTRSDEPNQAPSMADQITARLAEQRGTVDGQEQPIEMINQYHNPNQQDPFLKANDHRSDYDYAMQDVDEKAMGDMNISDGLVGSYLYGSKEQLTPAIVDQRKRRVEERKKQDRIPIVCRFINHELKGGSARFCFRQYADEPIRILEFLDGKVYKINVGLMRHVNDNCRIRVHQYDESVSTAEGNIYDATSGGKRPKQLQIKKPNYTSITYPRYEFIPVQLKTIPR
jgi:hypothetical protein